MHDNIADAAPDSPERIQTLRDADRQVIPSLLAGVNRFRLRAISASGQIEVVVVHKVNGKPTGNRSAPQPHLS